MKLTVSDLWDKLFEKYNILKVIIEEGSFVITADMIREFKEPRLMTKFDYYKQLPKIFKDNNLGILPIDNGKYIIGKYNMFQNISKSIYDSVEIVEKQLPQYIETIDPDNIYSESNALNVALISGMINDVVGEKSLLTIQGKMRSMGFMFDIEGENGVNNIDVHKPAMEIDGGYESKNIVALVEAKNSMPDDFVIRQLYYPYRHWIEKTEKTVVPIFFTYDNSIYTFFKYEFSNKYNYNSLELKSVNRFVINDKTSFDKKIEIFNSIKPLSDKNNDDLVFPQADSFNKVFGIMDLINGDIDTAEKISEEYDFTTRQANYYLAAAKYLILVKESELKGKYILTDNGLGLMNLDYKKRNAYLIESILRHEAFYNTFKYYLDNDKIPNKDIIVSYIMESTNIENDEVLKRRASTVRSWIEWVIGCQID